MKQDPRSHRAGRALAIAALIVLVGGLTVAVATEPPVERTAPPSEGTSPPSQMERQSGGCGACQGRMGAGAGGACPGRMSGEPGRGMQHRQGQGGGSGMGMGMGMGKGKGNGMGMGMGRTEMQAIHSLVHEYRQQVVRTVEEIPGGVATVTRIPDHPEGVETLQRHVREMQTMLESGGRIRDWDPLFSEIFDHYDQVEMVVEMLDDGVRVLETSADPDVVKLIRAHAEKVDEFIARGPAAVHETTPLPEGYRGSK